MKYFIKKVKDELSLSEENAIHMAKKQLNEMNAFAAVYGNKIDGEKKFFTPILVDEKNLKEMEKEVLEKDPEGRLYAIYKEHLEDAPLYEIEYKNGEAWIDIPDEEIAEFMKKRLIQIANNPRLFDKYKSDIQDMLEKELQEYANHQFYEQGKGEVYSEDAKIYKNIDDVVIDYKDLEITVFGDHHEGNFYEPAWDDESEMKVDFEFTVDAKDAMELISEEAEKDGLFEDMSDEEIEQYLDEHWEELVNKYDYVLYSAYENAAKEAAQEQYNERY